MKGFHQKNIGIFLSRHVAGRHTASRVQRYLSTCEIEEDMEEEISSLDGEMTDHLAQSGARGKQITLCCAKVSAR
jgi:hypothetical protein